MLNTEQVEVLREG